MYKWGIATFLSLYISITFTLYVGKLLFLWSLELAMQDFHPSLDSTKTLYYWYVFDPFW